MKLETRENVMRMIDDEADAAVRWAEATSGPLTQRERDAIRYSAETVAMRVISRIGAMKPD